MNIRSAVNSDSTCTLLEYLGIVYTNGHIMKKSWKGAHDTENLLQGIDAPRWVPGGGQRVGPGRLDRQYHRHYLRDRYPVTY